LSALKKNLAPTDSEEHREMTMPTWQLRLLLAGQPPRWQLVDK